jgi:hypothetical protein
VLVVDVDRAMPPPVYARSTPAPLFAASRGRGTPIKGFDALRTTPWSRWTPTPSIREYFPEFVTAAEAGADLVLGARTRSRDMPGLRRFANAMSSGWTTALAGRTVSDSQCGYRLYGREVIARTPMTAGRYELETEVIVRAARLGFRLAEVQVPTVYADETSQFRLVRDVPRIVGTMMRLTLEGIVPPAPMRAALRAARAESPATR